jgi:hypothetical protein
MIIKEKIRKYEQNIQDLCNTIKRPNLQIMDTEKIEELQAKA